MATHTKKSTRPAPKSRRQQSSEPYALNDRSDHTGLEGLEGLEGPDGGAEMTGNLLVSTVEDNEDSLDVAVNRILSLSGITAASVCSTADFDSDDGISSNAMDDASIIRFEELKIAVVKGDPDEIATASTATAQDDGIIVEPEYWNFPLGEPSTRTAFEILTEYGFDDEVETPIGNEIGEGNVSREFLLGARAAIDIMLGTDSGESGILPAAHRCLRDSRSLTWGMQATRVGVSQLSGRGVRVAVLDTGFDAAHPDFGGRSITQASFIPSSEPDNDPGDSNGHGTHCIGTSCGSNRPTVGPRYGIAFEAEIFSGKVLRQGPRGASGADGWILAGIDWALRNRCHIISMSLGSRANSPQYPMAYERAARAGLQRGTLIVAATGNDSNRRRGLVAPVGRPANCPSIASVAAIDSCQRVATFSNGQRFGNGGEVNFTGPGVDVLSSVPRPRLRDIFDGTSMATPHAAGVAALNVQATGATGVALYREMTRRCLNLGNRTAFGNGLIRI